MIEKEFEKKHIQEIIKRNRKIEKIFEHTSKDLARVIRQYEISQGIKGVTTEKIHKGYTWQRNMALKRKVDKLLEELRKDIKTNIQEGIITHWDLANIKNNKLVEDWWRGLGLKSADIPTAFQELNLASLNTFLARAEAGMNLSKRVWNLANEAKDQLETYLASGITTGKSAVRISKELEQFMAGKGVPYKGVLIKAKNIKFQTIRLAATETNMAYRMSDYVRRQQLPFVVGIEVHLSASHPRADICDQLQGQYPKGFIFTGWHPLCICYTTSIMLDQKDSLSLMEKGEIVKSRYIRTIPKSAKAWIEENAEKIAKWKNRPYWISDNFTKDFKLKKRVTIVGLPVGLPKETAEIPKFVPAKTMEEAHRFAKTLVNYKGTVDFGKISLENANRINKRLYELINEYKIKTDFIGSSQAYNRLLRRKYPGIRTNPVSKRVLAQVVGLQEKGKVLERGITFNEFYFGKGEESKKRLEQALKSVVKTGFSKHDTVESVIDHEYGHVIDYAKKISSNPQFVKEVMILRKEARIKQILGGYAQGDGTKEQWAEAFALFKVKKLPESMMRLIREVLR